MKPHTRNLLTEQATSPRDNQAPESQVTGTHRRSGTLSSAAPEGAGGAAAILRMHRGRPSGLRAAAPPQPAPWRPPGRWGAAGAAAAAAAPSATGTPACCWHRSTGSEPGRASAMCGWRWVRRRSPCTAWCWLPAALTSRRCWRAAWRRAAATWCASRASRRTSSGRCWTSSTRVMTGTGMGTGRGGLPPGVVAPLQVPRRGSGALCLPAGVVSIGEHNVQELIVAADMLQLSEVVELCCEFLKGQVDPLNCIGLFQFAEQIACHDLLEFTESYIHAHFLEVQGGEEFLALTKEQLVKILRSEDLSIEDEYQVFVAAMQWILKDLGKRRKYVVEVLEPVRFPLLPAQRLLKYIEGKWGKARRNIRCLISTCLAWIQSCCIVMGFVRLISWEVKRSTLYQMSCVF